MQLILIQIKISGRYAKRINGVLCIYSQLSVGQIWRAWWVRAKTAIDNNYSPAESIFYIYNIAKKRIYN